MSKRFKATWGEGYSLPGTKYVSEEFFYPDNSYSLKEIRDIKQLKIGEKLDLSDISGKHTVERCS